MPRFSAAIGGAIILGLVLVQTPANAALDMVAGARGTAVNAPSTECNTKAKAALGSVLLNPFEAGEGTGQWMANGPADSDGQTHAAAALHCFPVGKGYVVTLACAVERPNSTESATDLCGRIEQAFGTDATGGVTWR